MLCGEPVYILKSIHEFGRAHRLFPAEATQLWRYNLHYFDYTENLAYEYLDNENDTWYNIFVRLAKEWMRACPLATPLARDPYSGYYG